MVVALESEPNRRAAKTEDAPVWPADSYAGEGSAVTFTLPYYVKAKAAITEPIIRANKIAIVAVVIAIIALGIAIGGFSSAS
jgi:hypothetical protein